jgi:hypothetical protein
MHRALPGTPNKLRNVSDLLFPHIPTILLYSESEMLESITFIDWIIEITASIHIMIILELCVTIIMAGELIGSLPLLPFFIKNI